VTGADSGASAGAAGPPALTPAARARRELVIDAVVGPSLPRPVVAAAVDAVASHPAVLRDLAAAFRADRQALATGAPPAVGRLAEQLIAAGATIVSRPSCARCGRTGFPLTRSAEGGVCGRCRRRQLAEACVRCQVVKPVASRDGAGRPVCARCGDRPQRRCGNCGQVRAVGRRAGPDGPDICVNCYRMPTDTCNLCRRRRPCNYAGTPQATCKTCMPRRAVPCAHCGQSRPPTVRRPEGPVCDPCYMVALRHRGPCARCGADRRLVSPPGPAATTCADCARLPAGPRCLDCAREDKLYERGRCAPCSLRRRSHDILRAGAPTIPDHLMEVHTAICASPAPRSALNWLRDGAAARLLADLAAGRLDRSHQALDAHPARRAANYLRQLLVTHDVLPERNEALARAEQRVAAAVANVHPGEHRRLVHAYATWHVLRRLRRRAGQGGRVRTVTAVPENQIRAAITFLSWVADQGMAVAELTQADLDRWLTTGPAAPTVRDFLTWAADHAHTIRLTVPPAPRHSGPALDGQQRIHLLRQLLHDDQLDLTDRVAGALLLLYGQHLSRISTLTTDQITYHGDDVHLRLGPDPIRLPDPLATLTARLVQQGRHHVGIGSPQHTRWLFPGGLPGRPLTPAQLGRRLRTLGVPAIIGRRAALTELGAYLPAAVLAELLQLHPTTAVRWVRDAGGDWATYAASLAAQAVTKPAQ
jgi:hypothetical protein